HALPAGRQDSRCPTPRHHNASKDERSPENPAVRFPTPAARPRSAHGVAPAANAPNLAAATTIPAPSHGCPGRILPIPGPARIAECDFPRIHRTLRSGSSLPFLLPTRQPGGKSPAVRGTARSYAGREDLLSSARPVLSPESRARESPCPPLRIWA